MCLYTHTEKHAYFWNTKVNILAKVNFNHGAEEQWNSRDQVYLKKVKCYMNSCLFKPQLIATI